MIPTQRYRTKNAPPGKNSTQYIYIKYNSIRISSLNHCFCAISLCVSPVPPSVPLRVVDCSATAATSVSHSTFWRAYASLLSRMADWYSAFHVSNGKQKQRLSLAATQTNARASEWPLSYMLQLDAEVHPHWNQILIDNKLKRLL